jgi:hypothetical protein
MIGNSEPTEEHPPVKTCCLYPSRPRMSPDTTFDEYGQINVARGSVTSQCDCIG